MNCNQYRMFICLLTGFIKGVTLNYPINIRQIQTMTLQMIPPDRHLDRQGWQLLRLLQTNCRLSLRALGEVIGLTAPAVAERMHRLEEAGIITGYYADVDLAKAGLTVQAFILLTTNSQQSVGFRKAGDRHVRGG